MIVASRWDEAAATLAERWAGYGCRLLTPDDLSEPGWRYRVGRAGESRAVADGQPLDAADIAGLLVRLPGVSGRELLRIDTEHRDYAAAEMHAFLAAWLTELPCPVLNRPTPGCLAGPAWRPEQWTHAAAGLGIPTLPITRSEDVTGQVDADAGAGRLSVTVVSGRPVGAPPELLVDRALRLAAAAGVDLLTAVFTHEEEPRLIGASPWPDIGDDAVADAIRNVLIRA